MLIEGSEDPKVRRERYSDGGREGGVYPQTGVVCLRMILGWAGCQRWNVKEGDRVMRSKSCLKKKHRNLGVARARRPKRFGETT